VSVVYTNPRDGGKEKSASSRHPLQSKNVVSVTIFNQCLLGVQECEDFHVVVSVGYKVHLDTLIWF